MIWIFFTIICIIDVLEKQHSQATADYENYNSTKLVSRNEWTDCKGKCGETGYMSRYRSTTTSGVLCGFNYEWKTCHILGCTIHDYTKLIYDKCILDHCEYNAVKSILANNADRFWNAFLCVKHNLGCPVKGGWSKWTSWSKCTATCGSGIQYRIRYCDHPQPSRTSLNCSGDHIEFQSCFGKSCTALTNGTWCKWSNWSRCSVRQGNGVVIRKRFCRHLYNSLYTSCLGPHTEINQCYIPGVKGGWSEWQKWSPCSSKCDKGTRYRMRSCSRPEPEGFGQDCTGESIQINDCYLEPCKGPPIMVATFDKQSHLKYAATEISTTLLHVIIRFYPLDMTGTILRRFDDDCENCNSVQLNLIDSSLFLTAILNGYNVTLLSPLTVNIGWNEVSFTITSNAVTLQLNNDQISKHVKRIDSISTMNLDQVMNIGEDFEGFIEKLYVNFIPYALTINDKFSDMYLPYATFNTIFELSDEQSYTDLSKTIKIPCPQFSIFWKTITSMRYL